MTTHDVESLATDTNSTVRVSYVDSTQLIVSASTFTKSVMVTCTPEEFRSDAFRETVKRKIS
jgi:hypothetical protein